MSAGNLYKHFISLSGNPAFFVTATCLLSIYPSVAVIDGNQYKIFIDEIISWMAAIADIWPTPNHEPPLPILINKIILFLSPHPGVEYLRASGILWRMLLILSGYIYLNNLLGRRFATSFALLIFISPMSIQWASLARPYSLLILITSLVFFSYWRALKSETVLSSMVFMFFSTIAMYAHMLSIFPCFSFLSFSLLSAALRFLKHGNDDSGFRTRMRLTSCSFTAILLGLIWILPREPFTANILSGPPSVSFLEYLGYALFYLTYYGPNADSNNVIMILMFLMLFIGTVSLYRRNREVLHLIVLLSLITLSGTYLTIGYKYNYIGSYRYIGLLLGPILVVVAAGLNQTAEWILKTPFSGRFRFPAITYTALCLMINFSYSDNFKSVINETYYRNIFSDIPYSGISGIISYFEGDVPRNINYWYYYIGDGFKYYEMKQNKLRRMVKTKKNIKGRSVLRYGRVAKSVKGDYLINIPETGQKKTLNHPFKCSELTQAEPTIYICRDIELI